MRLKPFVFITIAALAMPLAISTAQAQITNVNGSSVTPGLLQTITPSNVGSTGVTPTSTPPPPAPVVGTNPLPRVSPAALREQQLQLQLQQQQSNPQFIPNGPPSSETGANGLPAGFPTSMPSGNGESGSNNGGKERKFVPSEVVSALPPAAKVNEIRAVLRTSVGDITIRLDRGNAPKTTEYFTQLARGEVDFMDVKTSKPVRRPFYNGLTFHRVVKNTLIQTGDPFGNGRGDSGTMLADEIKPSMKFDRPGLVAMAPSRDGTGTKLMPNSNSSQFFITLREMPEWNGQFTIFGVVEDGMDVVQKIANVKVGPTERPIKRIYLVAVEIIESNK